LTRVYQFAATAGDPAACYAAYFRFAGQVAPGEEWDMKPVMYEYFKAERDEWDYFAARFGPDWWYYYDVIGNVGYGYFGAAAGFSDAELLDGAGLAQLGHDALRWAFSHLIGVWAPELAPELRAGATIPRGFDPLQDQVAIELGIRLWHEYGLALTPEDLTVALALEPRLQSFSNPIEMVGPGPGYWESPGVWVDAPQ
jgi:hypothetical protein